MNQRRDQGKKAKNVRGASKETRQAGDRAFRRPPPGPQWPGREITAVERNGVPATDTEARTPLGVGTSTSRRAERMGPPAGDRDRGRRGMRDRLRHPRGTQPEPEEELTRPSPLRRKASQQPTGDQSG